MSQSTAGLSEAPEPGKGKINKKLYTVGLVPKCALERAINHSNAYILC